MLLANPALDNPAHEIAPTLPLEVYRNMDKSARRDPATLEAVEREWPDYIEALDAMIDEDDGDGVPVECFVDVYHRIMRLSAYGVKFSPMFMAWFEELQQQVIGTEEDGDFDPTDIVDETDDSEFEADDCDREYDDSEIDGMGPVIPLVERIGVGYRPIVDCLTIFIRGSEYCVKVSDRLLFYEGKSVDALFVEDDGDIWISHAIDPHLRVAAIVDLLVERFAPKHLASIVVRRLHTKEVLNGLQKYGEHLISQITATAPPAFATRMRRHNYPTFGVNAGLEPLERYRRQHEAKLAELTAAVKSLDTDRLCMIDLDQPTQARSVIRVKRREANNRKPIAGHQDARRNAELSIALALTHELSDASDDPHEGWCDQDENENRDSSCVE